MNEWSRDKFAAKNKSLEICATGHLVSLTIQDEAESDISHVPSFQIYGGYGISNHLDVACIKRSTALYLSCIAGPARLVAALCV